MTENPKDIAGPAKLPFADIPGIVLAEVGLALPEGARKSGACNHLQTPLAPSAPANPPTPPPPPGRRGRF